MNSNVLLSGKERIILFVTVVAGVDGFVCFAIEMSSATQNWMKISDGQG